MRIYQILLLVLALTLSNCMTDEYNLSKGLNTDMTLGGDSLSIPLLKDSISLGKLITTNDSSLIKKNPLDGSYSISMKDSMTPQKIDSIPRVSFNIAAITIPDIVTNFATVKFPTIENITSTVSTSLPIPDLTIANQTISGINTTFNMGAKLPTLPSPTKGINKTKSLGSFTTTVGIIDSSKINQTLNFNYPEQLSKINTIFLTGSTVTMTFTRKSPVALSNISDTIKSFSIVFPSEFKLSNATGTGASIGNGSSSFIITNAKLTGNTYTASFVMTNMDMSGYPQDKKMDYNKDIPYKLNYSCKGLIDPSAITSGDSLKVNISLNASSQIADMLVDTNPFKVKVAPGNTAVTKAVPNIPDGISRVNSLTFENGAAMKLIIANPNIQPFKFSKGNCVFTLPASLSYTSLSGAVGNSILAGNTLTIPGDEISGGKSINIGVSGMNIDKDIVNHSINVSDQLLYSIKNPDDSLEVGAILNTSFNDLLSKSGTGLNFKGEISGLNVKDANITTTQLNLPIDKQKKVVSIDQFVSNDVKKIYSIKLKDATDLTINFNISGLSSSIPEIIFDNYTIKFPPSLKLYLENTNSNYSFSGNTLTLIKIPVSGGKGLLTIPLKLGNIDFGNNGKDLLLGAFNLNDSVVMTGAAHIAGVNMNSNSIGTVTVKPTILIGTMFVSEIWAKIAPPMPTLSQPIPLDLPNMLKNDSNNLSIDNPIIEIQFGNTTGIPIYIPLKLIPKKKDGSVITAGIIDNTNNTIDSINIRSAVIPGQTTWSKYRLSAKPTGLMNDDYTPIIIPNLSNLLQTIPDEIYMEVIPKIIGEKQHIYLYSPKNQLEIKYKVIVPFMFGEKFKFQFNDTINDLKKSLSSFKLPKQVDLIAKTDNKIPMDLALKLSPLDANGVVIPGISITADPIKYDSNVHTMQTAVFSLKENPANPGDLDKLDKVIVTVTASKNYATSLIPLKADQYFKLELRVKLPKGITIKQNLNKK